MPQWRGVCLCLLAASVWIAGCTTSRPTATKGMVPGVKNTLYEEHAASREVDDARRAIEAGGDASGVIPRLLNIVTRYPKTTAALDARYWLGAAYYEIGGYRDAIDMFNEYMRLAPEGRYAKACVEQVNKLDAEYKKKYPSPEILDEQVRKLKDLAGKQPNDLQTQLDLADALWKRGDYANAGVIYSALVKVHPEFAQDLTVKSRVEFLPNGGYIVLSPDEIQHRAIQEQPLQVINTADFKSGEDLFTRQPRFYSVTGQVVNRSDSVLYGVQVTVTIYGFGKTVYDTQPYNIGRLNPGEIKAFSVRFSNFDNIENVNRYECVPSFER